MRLTKLTVRIFLSGLLDNPIMEEESNPNALLENDGLFNIDKSCGHFFLKVQDDDIPHLVSEFKSSLMVHLRNDL